MVIERIGRLVLGNGGRQIVAINRQKPADRRATAHQISGRPRSIAQVRHIHFGRRTKDVREHVEEVNADIRRDAAGFGVIALPGM